MKINKLLESKRLNEDVMSNISVNGKKLIQYLEQNKFTKSGDGKKSLVYTKTEDKNLMVVSFTELDIRVKLTADGKTQEVPFKHKEAVKAYMAVRPNDGVATADKNALFLSSRHKRISNKTVQHIVYVALEKAGLSGQGYSVHKLRHTAATLMYQHGNVDIRVLKDILGHENLGTTQIYTHISNTQVEDAFDSNPLAKFKQK